MYGIAPCFMLVMWGDVAAMRAGLAKVLDAHAQIAGRIRRGEEAANSCAPPRLSIRAARRRHLSSAADGVPCDHGQVHA